MSNEGTMDRVVLHSFIRGRYRMYDGDLRFLLDKSEAQLTRYQISCQEDKEALSFFDFIRKYREILRETLEDDKCETSDKKGFCVLVSHCQRKSVYISCNSYNVTLMSK